EILVVDDGSTDATAEIAAARGARVVTAPPLPAGWAGTPHACAVGADAATGDWLLFADADTVAAPDLVRRAVATASRDDIDVLSPNPAQVVEGFWERVIVPAGFFLLAVTRDVRRLNDPDHPDAVANGQCVLVRTAAYRAFGGHAAVRSEILEDVALARTAASHGWRVVIADGSDHVRTRMYRSASEVWHGLTKNAALVAGGPVPAVPAGLVLLVLGAAPLAVPVLAVGAGGPWSVAAAVTGTALFAGTALKGPRYFGLRRPWGLTLPIGLVASGVITLASAWKTLRGTRAWKGRRY
ncbi:MAG: glycosyltransferase, partial [Acidimicrobiia bacterium]|nr:glycosyltransferase [Acidimicrobiia bacterium]